MATDGPPIFAGEPEALPDAPPGPRAVTRPKTVLDLMIAVATCSLLFGAHRLLLDALGDQPVRAMANSATGILLALTAGHLLLTTLRRRHDWRGLGESRDFVLIMILTFGLMAATFSCLAAPAAGALYLAATLVILFFALRRP